MALAGLQKCIEHYWYSSPGPLWLLYPLECLYRIISAHKRSRHSAKQSALAVPVLVVGNISVGGTGKTPTLISLLNFLRAQGLHPGVVSRGYGRTDKQLRLVDASSLSLEVGEEPLLIFQQTGCPVCVHSDRLQAANYLLRQHPDCDVILADDGLQHYRLPRDFELALIDGERLLGNRHLLPVGPLREPVQRLCAVDWIVVNQRNGTEHGKDISALFGKPDKSKSAKTASKLSSAYLENTGVSHIQGKHELTLTAFRSGLAGQTLFAVAAIGHPQAFFKSAEALSVRCKTLRYADHHFWQAHELQVFSGQHMLCTAKDAVKIKELLKQHSELDASHWYFLQVELRLDEALMQDIYSRIKERICEV